MKALIFLLLLAPPLIVNAHSNHLVHGTVFHEYVHAFSFLIYAATVVFLIYAIYRELRIKPG